MIRFLVTIVLLLGAVTQGFASENEDWAGQYSMATEKALRERQATDFYLDLAKETATEADHRLHGYLSTLKDLKTPTGDECVLWFQEFRPDLRLSTTAPDLYNKEMDALWKYVSNNGCWKATQQARNSSQWSQMNCSADIIRHIRGYLGVGAKY